MGGSKTWINWINGGLEMNRDGKMSIDRASHNFGVYIHQRRDQDTKGIIKLRKHCSWSELPHNPCA